MLGSYTAKYTKIDSGYMGQLVEWPEVITEGQSLDPRSVELLNLVNNVPYSPRFASRPATIPSTSPPSTPADSFPNPLNCYLTDSTNNDIMCSWRTLRKS